MPTAIMAAGRAGELPQASRYFEAAAADRGAEADGRDSSCGEACFRIQRLTWKDIGFFEAYAGSFS